MSAVGSISDFSAIEHRIVVAIFVVTGADIWCAWAGSDNACHGQTGSISFEIGMRIAISLLGFTSGSDPTPNLSAVVRIGVRLPSGIELKIVCIVIATIFIERAGSLQHLAGHVVSDHRPIAAAGLVVARLATSQLAGMVAEMVFRMVYRELITISLWRVRIEGIGFLDRRPDGLGGVRDIQQQIVLSFPVRVPLAMLIESAIDRLMISRIGSRRGDVVEFVVVGAIPFVMIIRGLAAIGRAVAAATAGLPCLQGGIPRLVGRVLRVIVFIAGLMLRQRNAANPGRRYIVGRCAVALGGGMIGLRIVLRA